MQQRLRPQAAERDAGLSLVELMVAIVLFGLLATAVMTTLNYTINTTRNDRNRVAAATLAQRELEIVRNQFYNGQQGQGPKTITVNQVTNPSPLPGGTSGSPLVVDGTEYTVVREATWSNSAGGGTASSPCENGGTNELAYLKVHVEVTWKKMGSIQPVTSDTLLTPPKGTYTSDTGHIGVKVVDRDGKPQAGVPVTITGPSSQSGATASDGCAVFAFLPVGSYTVTMTDTGFVNSKNEPAPSYPASVQVGAITRLAVDYDRAATLQVALAAPGGYTLPTPTAVGVVIGHSALLPSGRATYNGTGSSRTISSLFPFSGGYEVWAGTCLDADPQFYGGSRPALAAATPGSSTAVSVPLYPVDLLVKESDGDLEVGKTIIAKHVVNGSLGGDAGCPSGPGIPGETHTLGITDGTGRVAGSLPMGSWQFEVSGAGAGPVPVQATIDPTNPFAAETVVTP
jgi:prepilin-type N-terminal cleavage/methylation domain-containing protein